jgi:peptidase M50-like protein
VKCLAAQQPQSETAVRSRFTVKDSFQLPDGEVEYKVEYHPDSRKRFEELHFELASLGLTPILVGSKDDAALIVRKKQLPPPPKSRIPTILTLLTLTSVIVFAIFQRISYQFFAPGIPGNVVFLTYSAAIMAIVGVHELGHFLFSRRSGTAAPTAYLIPGIPDVTAFLPALGDISRQREPAVNRDRFFDVMLVGPIIAFLGATVVYLVGAFFSVQSTTPLQGCQVVNTIQFCTINNGLFQSVLDWLTRGVTPHVTSGFVRFSPLQDAATVGFLLTFITLLPLASFDGGHLFSLAWGQRGARLASYLGVFLLISIDAPNYWAVAIVGLLVAGRSSEPQLLDELSGISPGRRWLYVGALVIAFLAIPVPQNLGFFPLR